MPAKYKVIITGLKPGGVSPDQARANLVKLLKAPAAKIDKLLESVPVVIKKNVERELGEKYLRVLSQAGVLAEIKPEVLELSLEPTEEKVTEETHQFTCPQCGIVVQKVGKCPACLANEVPAEETATTAARSVKRRQRNEKIRESAFALLVTWMRGNVIKAGLVFILLPIFGGNFLLSTVFYSKDKHLVYQTLTSRTVCLANPDDIMAPRNPADDELADIFYHSFTVEEKKELMEKWDNVACRAVYEMELGNIGDEPVTAHLRFATGKFVTGKRNSQLIVYRYFRNLSAATRREQDPKVKQENGIFTLQDIYPNTHITLKFGGWVDDKDAADSWELVLADINVDEGTVEVGDPLATAFGRLLTIFF